MSTTTTKNKHKEMTLLGAIERVVELSEGSKLSAAFMKKAGKEIRFLADSFGITPQQAVLFCISMEKGPRHIDYYDYANHLDMSRISIFNITDDLTALVRRQLLRYRDAKEQDTFDIPTDVLKALRHNKVYEMPKLKDLDCAELFEVMRKWFDDLSDDAVLPSLLSDDLNALFDDNPQIEFVKRLRALKLNKRNELMLVYFCHLQVNKDDDDIRPNQLEDICETMSDFTRLRGELRSGSHVLIERKLIEPYCEDGIVNNSRFKLTDEAKKNLLCELHMPAGEEKLSGVIDAGMITPKVLYYTEQVERQVDELKGFFQQDQYKLIKQRMQQRGFRQGFACLFYGGPGTGKTETVYQLARQTGRSIMVVDVPQIKSKWVGESEKNIKALFDQYRALVDKASVAPILLFNEADAIIGTRKSGASSAVDKMENTIQNIILQEMETLDGIMIATTNLEENLDPAFERRFLYKLKFVKPDASVRIHIWKSMIPELTEADAQAIASQYDFSGGQIENVARRYTVDCILHGNQKDILPLLSNLSSDEQLMKKNQRRIGFFR